MKPIDGYVLRSVEGRWYLVLETEDVYWIGRMLRKLQTMRERDLKEIFRKLEESMDE